MISSVYDAKRHFRIDPTVGRCQTKTESVFLGVENRLDGVVYGVAIEFVSIIGLRRSVRKIVVLFKNEVVDLPSCFRWLDDILVQNRLNP